MHFHTCTKGSSWFCLCIFPILVPFLLTEPHSMPFFRPGQQTAPAASRKGLMPTGKLLHLPPSVREPLEYLLGSAKTVNFASLSTPPWRCCLSLYLAASVDIFRCPLPKSSQVVSPGTHGDSCPTYFYPASRTNRECYLPYSVVTAARYKYST
ncbi:hypothetical protein J3F83DRAFT_733811 [Trichoderma novae-zelandiae]